MKNKQNQPNKKELFLFQLFWDFVNVQDDILLSAPRVWDILFGLETGLQSIIHLGHRLPYGRYLIISACMDSLHIHLQLLTGCSVS